MSDSNTHGTGAKTPRPLWVYPLGHPAPDGGDRCRRCGLGAEPATWYCGGCWPIVSALRTVAGDAFDALAENEKLYP